MASASAGSIFVDLLLRDGKYVEGLNRSRRSTRNWSQSTRKEFSGLSATISGLTTSALRFIGILGAGFSVVALSRAADVVTGLEGRLRQSTQTTQEFEQAFRGLADQSIRFGSDLSSGVSVFQRLSFVRKEINATVDEMLQFTETVQALGTASGATGEALRAGLTQLGQGLSSSVLRAEEFNSIMENIPAVGKAIADEFGVTTGQLRQLVVEGKVLSEDVFAAILNQTVKAREEFEKMPLTINRAIGSFNAQLDIVARNLFGVSGANQAIAESIQFATARLEEMGFFAYVIVEAFEALGVAAKQAFNDASVAFRDFYNKYSETIRGATGGIVDLGIITDIYDRTFDNPNAEKRIKDFAKEYGGIFEEEVKTSNRAISQDYQKLAQEISNSGVSESISSVNEKIKETAKIANETGVDLDQFGKRAAENIQDSFADFLFDPFAEGLDGMAKGFIDTIRRMIAEAQAAKLAQAIFGDLAGGQGGGILGGIFGGGSSGGIGKFFSGFFAEGGFIPPGHFGVAGEAGAEIVMGGRSGATVIPQSKMSGGNVYQIDARGADQGAVRRIEQALFALAGPGKIEQRMMNAEVRGAV